MSAPYGLCTDQVPECPWDGDEFVIVDMLRWMIAVADDDWPMMGFCASLLSFAYGNEGKLTPKQTKALVKVADRFLKDYDAGILECQNRDWPDDGHPLRYAATEGNA